MRYSIPIAAAALAAAAFAMPGVAQAQAYRASTATNVNLRAGPDRDYPVVAILPPAYPLTVAGCIEGYTWCDVIADNGLRGWIWAGNISYYYQGVPVTVYDYGPAIGIGILGFVLGDYWHDHYYDRPFYRERDRWIRHAPPAPRPSWRPQPRSDWHPGDRPDYRPGERPPRPGDRPSARPGGDPFQGRTPWQTSPDQAPPGDVTQPRRAPPAQQPAAPIGQRPAPQQPHMAPPQVQAVPPVQPQQQVRPQPQPQQQVRPQPHAQPAPVQVQPQGGPAPQPRGEGRRDGGRDGRDGRDNDRRGDGR